MRGQFHFFFAFLLIFFGCTAQKTFNEGNDVPTIEDEGDLALQKCVSLCESEKVNGTNLDSSPCLSDKIIEGWVCDVAHNPRLEIDNIAENQCSAFGNGIAKHFVELDKNCSLIKKY